jgi:hypothetical protein
MRAFYMVLKQKNPKPFGLGFLQTQGWKTGFEPATSGTTIQRSNQLSYNHHLKRMQKYFFVMIRPKYFLKSSDLLFPS